MFRQAKKNRTFEDIIRQIQDAILHGEFTAGSRLPSERKLQKIFNVSRNTLREALRALEQKKLVEIKTGTDGGIYVLEINGRQVSETLDLLLKFHKISLKELAEFRETIEELVAVKATKKAKKKDIEELMAYVESIRNHLRTDELRWDEIMREDNLFHRKIAKIAGNRLFDLGLCIVYDNITSYFDRCLPKETKILEKVYRDLSRIAMAIQERKEKQTGLLVRRHVRWFDRRMKGGILDADGKQSKGESFLN